MAICAMIGAVRFSAFFSTTKKRPAHSIIAVTLAGPNVGRNSVDRLFSTRAACNGRRHRRYPQRILIGSQLVPHCGP